MVWRPRQDVSLPAYDAFLRGEAAFQANSAGPTALRKAIAAYEQAVALDPTFASAWARLAQAQATLYAVSIPTPAGAEAARRAAERALAIAPARPEGHQAFGRYYHAVLRDNSRALKEDSTALALDPSNTDLLRAIARVQRALGRWPAARDHLERAAKLDPRSGTRARSLGDLLLYTRHYPEAEQALDRSLELLPPDVLWARETRAMVSLAQGDLAGAQAILKAVPNQVDPTAVVAFMAYAYDLYWVLDEGE
jgi:tetratricopeptide (TPR) repeat protein